MLEKELYCVLSDDELKERGMILGEKHQLLSELKESKKIKVRQLDTDIKKIEAEIDSLSFSVARGKELRYVECIEEADYNNKKINIIRTDTYETIETRQMSGEELQVKLFNDNMEA